MLYFINLRIVVFFQSALLAGLLSFALVVWIAVGGKVYGTNTEPLPTATHNCSVFGQWKNSTHHDFSSYQRYEWTTPNLDVTDANSSMSTESLAAEAK